MNADRLCTMTCMVVQHHVSSMQSERCSCSCRIAVALLAQFYPKKHPDNWAVLLVCLVLYCIGSTFLSLFSALYEEDACFITRPKKV